MKENVCVYIYIIIYIYVYIYNRITCLHSRNIVNNYTFLK